jgi:tRNA nucleotidyltransferase (CCA-adding enzyme)
LKLSIDDGELDFSLPRTELKVSNGHKGFEISTDGNMDFATAARRRDFTINAIGYDPADGGYLDPFGGRSDIESGILRHIDDRSFVEDPLRVYRAVQFIARLELKIAEETFELCRQMVQQGMLDELPKERVWEEWKKLLHSPKPSIGFELMRSLGIIERYFPELHSIIDVPQNPDYHPEGDVWTHTMMTVDVMAKELKMKNEKLKTKDKLKLLLAILCHDLGKATHTTIEYNDKVEVYTSSTHYPLPTTHSNVRIRAIGHEVAGVEPTRSLLYRLTDEQALVERILPLVEHHLAPAHYYRNGARDKTIRRLSLKLTPHTSIRDLITVAKADFFGRGPFDDKKDRLFEAGKWLEDKAIELKVYDAPPKPLLRGQDLIDMEMEPSARIGEILEDVYLEQIRGRIKTKAEALRYIEKILF